MEVPLRAPERSPNRGIRRGHRLTHAICWGTCHFKKIRCKQWFFNNFNNLCMSIFCSILFMFHAPKSRDVFSLSGSDGPSPGEVVEVNSPSERSWLFLETCCFPIGFDSFDTPRPHRCLASKISSLIHDSNGLSLTGGRTESVKGLGRQQFWALQKISQKHHLQPQISSIFDPFLTSLTTS